jgi:hypothetical protein
MVAVDIEQAVHEGSGAAELVFGVETFEIEHGGNAVNPHALAGQLQGLFALDFGVDHQMAEFFGQSDEIALGVDDRLLHPGNALFQQPAQKVRLAGAGIALHQQAGGEQLLQIERRWGARIRASHLDGNRHVSIRSLRHGRVL